MAMRAHGLSPWIQCMKMVVHKSIEFNTNFFFSSGVCVCVFCGAKWLEEPSNTLANLVKCHCFNVLGGSILWPYERWPILPSFKHSSPFLKGIVQAYKKRKALIDTSSFVKWCCWLSTIRRESNIGIWAQGIALGGVPMQIKLSNMRHYHVHQETSRCLVTRNCLNEETILSTMSGLDAERLFKMYKGTSWCTLRLQTIKLCLVR